MFFSVFICLNLGVIINRYIPLFIIGCQITAAVKHQCLLFQKRHVFRRCILLRRVSMNFVQVSAVLKDYSSVGWSALDGRPCTVSKFNKLAVFCCYRILFWRDNNFKRFNMSVIIFDYLTCGIIAYYLYINILTPAFFSF